MAAIWLPGDSNATIALRGPSLLSPKKQPASPLRLRHNRISDGLVFAGVFNNQHRRRNFVGENITYTGSGITYTPEAVAFPGGSGNYASLGFNGNRLANKPIVIILKSKNASVDQCSVLGCGEAQDGASNRINVHLPYAGTVYWDYGTLNGGGRISVVDTISTTEYVVWAFVAYPSRPYMAIWKNGKIIAEQSSGNAYTSGADPFCLGKFSTLNFNGKIEFCYIFDTELSNAEIQALSNDPYNALFLPSDISPFYANAGSVFPFRLGSTQINSASLGSVPITEIYRGSTKLWP